MCFMFVLILASYGVGVCVNVCGIFCVVSYVWVLSVVLWCSVVGVWGVAMFVLSVMCVVGVCVSSCRWCVFVSVVHPVTILSAVFCVICSLLMFVSDASGDHIWWKRTRVWVLLWLCMLR